MESAWRRGWIDTERVRKTWLARSIVAVLDIVLAVYVAEVLASANKASVNVAVLTVMALVGGPFAAVGIVYAAQAIVAPLRQRNEARAVAPYLRMQYDDKTAAIDRAMKTNQEAYSESFDRKSAETEKLRGLLGVEELKNRELTSTIQELKARIEELTPLPHSGIAASFMLDGDLFRLGLMNQGPGEIDGLLINLLVPAVWECQAVDAYGEILKQWSFMKSDESVEAEDGNVVPMILWSRNDPAKFKAQITHTYFFRIKAVPGSYPVSVRIPPFGAQDLLIVIPPTEKSA